VRVVWKVLAAALVVLPPAAYVTGALAGSAEESPVRPVIVLRPAGDTRTPGPTGTPTATPTPSPRPSPGGDDPRRCEDDDDHDVVIPCPEGDDDRDDDREDDREDDRGGPDDDGGDGDDRGDGDRSGSGDDDSGDDDSGSEDDD
jgi:hypothetical protein